MTWFPVSAPSRGLRLLGAWLRRLDADLAGAATRNAGSRLDADRTRRSLHEAIALRDLRGLTRDRGEAAPQARTTTVPATRSCSPRWSASQISGGTARASRVERRSALGMPTGPGPSRTTRSPATR